LPFVNQTAISDTGCVISASGTKPGAKDSALRETDGEAPTPIAPRLNAEALRKARLEFRVFFRFTLSRSGLPAVYVSREIPFAGQWRLAKLSSKEYIRFQTWSGAMEETVFPDMIKTPMSDKMIAEGQGPKLDKMLHTFVPMKRLGRPEEIADAVLWLCSDKASYVTGQSISVDGGHVMR
jgi:hypothetical protein